MNANNIQWIVETPFNQRIYASVTNGTVDYSGTLYNNNGPNMTVEEYLNHKQKADQYKAPRVVSDEEFRQLYRNALDEQKTGFTEITEERYMDALECLPPMKWHDIEKGLNVFFCMEAWDADLHSCYIFDRVNKKYYSALRSKFDSDEKLKEVFLTSINA